MSFPVSRLFRVRSIVALVLAGGGVGLATLATTGVHLNSSIRRDKDMPTLGEKGEDLARLEADWNNRLTYPTGRFDPAWVRKAAEADAMIDSAVPLGRYRHAGIQSGRGRTTMSTMSLTPNTFVPLGPQPLHMTGCSGCYDFKTTSGRVNDIVVDPTTTTNGSIVAYLGTVGGGVWKTTNCCSGSTTWALTTNDPLLATVSIDTLTIDPNDHNTLYAGTGDLNYGSFSMGSHGILKTADGGNTWTLLGSDVFGPSYTEPAGQFPQYQAVGKVRVDPRNSSNVVAGTKAGLYFSYDAGNTWAGPCLTNSFTNMRQDITGLALIDTGTSTRIIAAVGTRGFATPVQFDLNKNGANGIYSGTLPASGCPGDFAPIISNSNGWTGTNPASGVQWGGTGTGNQLGRIDVAVAPSNSNYIYAQVQAISPQSSCGNSQGCQLGAWRTTDGGNTWTQIPGSTGSSLMDCELSGADYNQNWYDQGIAVDPNNPDRAFFDTFEVWMWQNPSATWLDTTCGYNAQNNGVHVDQHALAFVPGNSNILIVGNDGGVHGTTNALAQVGPTWFNMDNGLNTIEFYSGDISGNFATSPNPMASGGAQDNGASSVSFSGTPTGGVQWQMGKGGDGFYSRIDPVGTGTSLRVWQGNNSGSLSRCVSNCTASGASWSGASGAWSGDTQSFIMTFDLFHGGIPAGDDCAAAGASGGCGHLIAGTTRVWETIAGNASSFLTSSWKVTNNPTTQNMTKATLGNRSFINQVKYSPKFQSVAMAGTNDGNAWIGFNLGTGTTAGATWVNVTGGNAVLPNRPILGIALDATVSAANVPVGYAAVGGFNANTPATPGHIFQVACTANCASFTWVDKTGNLPDIPIDSVIMNPNVPQEVFAGTDFGLYFTNDITAASPIWYRFENGLPHTMIWDMQIDRGATTLSLWTRGRGAYVWPLPSSAIPTPQLLVKSVAHTADNHAVLSCSGVPAAINRIEASPDLSPNSWTTLQPSVMADGNGNFTFEDPNPDNLATRFYRVAYP